MVSRWKKEEERQRSKARADLNPEEIKRLNKKEQDEEHLETEIGRLHADLFPEEYDFMFDSFVDAKDRKMGKDPMSEDYRETVKHRLEIIDTIKLANKYDVSISSSEFIQKMLVDGNRKTLDELIEQIEIKYENERIRSREIDEPLQRYHSAPNLFESEIVQCAYELILDLVYNKNKLGFEKYVIKDLQARYPETSKEDVKKAYDNAHCEYMDDW